MSERVHVSDLVPLPREVKFDDTLREFHQVARFDIVDKNPLRTQLLLDRRHKENQKRSKPLGYFRMSSTDQLISLAVDALSLANILVLDGKRNISRDMIRSSTEDLFTLILRDIVNVTDVALNDLRMHQLVKEQQQNE